MEDCIAAISTATGTGGVAIIRISGENSLNLARRMFSAFPEDIRSNYMYAGKIAGDGFYDYGFGVYFRAPKTFTGEDVVEFHCHGGVQIARGILKRALSLGARAAEKGEFTKRAFMNGKLSLASAEGMIDMINAESLALLRAGSMMYTEKLTREVQAIQNKLKDELARIAVEIDYPEEDEQGTDLAATVKSLNEIHGGVYKLASTYGCGKKIKRGLTVAICGAPNVGKSSLLNALAGYDRAIVSPVAGTTRDTVECSVEIDGITCNFTDTAGIRKRAGKVENLGIERTYRAVESADIILSLTEGNGYAHSSDVTGEIIKVFNKCDKIKPEGDYDVAISALTGEGMDNLKKIITQKGMGEYASDKAYIVEERHYNALKRAEGALKSAIENIENLTLDVIAVDLREAWEALGEITGETASEEIISTVFAKFCVGK